MLGYFICLYTFLSLTIFSKILCTIFYCELYFICILIDVIERIDEQYYRDDLLDDVVDNFLDRFEDDDLYELNIFHQLYTIHLVR